MHYIIIILLMARMKVEKYHSMLRGIRLLIMQIKRYMPDGKQRVIQLTIMPIMVAAPWHQIQYLLEEK